MSSISYHSSLSRSAKPANRGGARSTTRCSCTTRSHREEFDLHYGQWAQVESTFASFKPKVGETLCSRKFTSQRNEILCMAIAHNLRVLVRQA